MPHYIFKKQLKNLNNLSNFSENLINNVWMNWTIYKDEKKTQNLKKWTE